jgi:hybrid polyketide synthase/nonribosomal peptide synthetase ACE1
MFSPPGAADTSVLSDESDFFHVGGNSGSLVRLHRAIRQTFYVTFPLVLMFEVSTLRAMATKIDSQYTEPRPIDWENETSINCIDVKDRAADIFKRAQPRINPEQQGKVLLLTGATGNLASALLPILVGNEKIARIHCVAVRDMEKAETVLNDTLSPSQRAKIQLYPGDLTMPRLGLALGDAFVPLMAEIDATVHLAAARTFWDNYETLRGGNVGSMRDLILLAAARSIPIHFISSGGVLRYTERPPPSDGSDGYVSGKWAVERTLERAARELGGPVTIYRTLSAKEEDNHQNPSARAEALDAFTRHAKAISALPSSSVADWDGCVDLLTLKHFAEGIANKLIIDNTGESPGRTNTTEVMTENYNAETKLTNKDIMAHLNVQLGRHEGLAGFERIDVLEWMGRLKRSGFPYMLAAMSLVHKRDEHGDVLTLDR